MKKFNLLLLMSLIFGALVFNSCNEEEVEEEVEEVVEEEEEETVTDIDGNKYKTVIIGAQEWFAENLRTTRYNDGNAIPTGTNTDWAALTGAYAVYHYSLIDGLNSDQEVLDGYGALYNWYAVNTGKLCPKGWHVPTDAEWTALTNYLGGETGAGGKLKSTRTAPVAHPRWDRPNTGATDAAGFSALPGGYREYGGGTFYYVGRWGFWWSSTEPSTYVAWSRGMYFYGDDVSRGTNDKERGFSVRCLRDKGVIPEAPRVTAPSSNIKVASGESVDVSFTVNVPRGYASANASAQGGSATISDEPAEGATSGTVVVSFTAGSAAGAASVTLTVIDQNKKTGNAIAHLSIEIPEAPTATAPSSNITVAAGESVDVSFTVNVPGGYASANASAQGGSATISDEPAEGATSGTVVVSFTAGSAAGEASVILTVTDQNKKSGNATANLPIYEEGEETVTDIDGNVYKTFVIGNQEWFAKNLRTTRYNDGTAIPTGYTNARWATLTTGAYAVYPYRFIDGLNSDQEVLDAYGALYNWYAVNTGKLCPDGWHVPTDTEWTALTNYLGGISGAGGKLKSTRTAPDDAHPRWNSPNTGATDEYGFSALPGGLRHYEFSDVGVYGLWWSSTFDWNASNTWARSMSYLNSDVYRGNYDKEVGFSVRCLRD